MKNRAKCKLCKSIIESFHSTDYVTCSCGEISVDGGEALLCAAKEWKNFVRVDDEGNEILVKVKDTPIEIPHEKPTKKDLLKMLTDMVENYEKLPQHAMTAPVTNYDLWAALALLSSILACED